MLLTELLANAGVFVPEPGSWPGSCYVCGRQTSHGHREAPSASFTAWASCSYGQVLCEFCKPALHTPELRRSSWIVTADEFVLARGEQRVALWQALLTPPSPPFAVYCTRAGQKQSWIALTRYVSVSDEQFWVGVDWLDMPVLMRHEFITAHSDLLLDMRARKISRDKLLGSSEFTVADYARAYADGWLCDIEAISRLIGMPQWEVMVHAVE